MKYEYLKKNNYFNNNTYYDFTLFELLKKTLRFFHFDFSKVQTRYNFFAEIFL